ncbi:S41 family peptidase [Streptomyces sp. SID13031]|uniref:S41 family peptidase n=1 Tax=Streptomyces sp. SID13031 TaxID=2706046 RepID=UPI0013C622FA|nr:S41 family peptidase [Streptomyces sp. SID13031]NEA34861.1 S41 family peptidase [Streptomyces sp. SID13031]
MKLTSLHRLLPIAGIAAGLVAAPLSGPLAAGAAASIDGVWQLDGYGTIVAIDNGKAGLFSTTSISCTPAGEFQQTGERFTADREQAFTVRVRRDRAVMHVEGNVGDKHLRRLAKLPKLCKVPGATGPLAVFDQFWTTYNENYPFFQAKGIDWAKVRDTYRPRVTPGISDAALSGLLSEMVEPLGDAHTAIRTADGETLFAGVRPGTTLPTPELEGVLRPYIEGTALKGVKFASYANERIGYADLPGRVGYLRVIAFMGYGDILDYNAERDTLNATLDKILTKERVKNLRGLIIDLRINGGGSDQLGLDLASRLTGKPFFAYAKRARNDPADPTAFTAPQPLFVQPSERTKYTGPIAILTGGSQMSAGETFTQAMMNRTPRPIRIGQNTQGVFSDVLVRTLPNGWQFIVPNEEFRTRDWKTFDGPGIAPDVRTPVFTPAEFAAERDTAFTTALKLLVR